MLYNGEEKIKFDQCLIIFKSPGGGEQAAEIINSEVNGPVETENSNQQEDEGKKLISLSRTVRRCTFKTDSFSGSEVVLWTACHKTCTFASLVGYICLSYDFTCMVHVVNVSFDKKLCSTFLSSPRCINGYQLS